MNTLIEAIDKHDTIVVFRNNCVENVKNELCGCIPEDGGVNAWGFIYKSLFSALDKFGYNSFVSSLRQFGYVQMYEGLFTIYYHKYMTKTTLYTDITNIVINKKMVLNYLKQYYMNIVELYNDVSFNTERKGSNPFPYGTCRLIPFRVKGYFAAKHPNGKLYLADKHMNPIGKLAWYDSIRYRPSRGGFEVTSNGNTFYIDMKGNPITQQQQVQETKSKTIIVKETKLRSIIRETLKRILLTV